MKTRLLGGAAVSEVGLGCWQIGGDQWGDVPESDALATLRAALDARITFYDTADIYGLGRSENLIAKFVADVGRRDLFLATKLGRWPEPGLPENAKAEHVRRFTEASLKRLNVETLDLTQLHCVPLPQLREGHIFDTLRALQQEGKIRRWGASVESTEEARVCLAQPGLASLQIIFNIYRQTPITAIFDECRAKGVAVIVRLPLASGMLAGKYTPATTFAPTDHRTYNRNGEKFNVGETFASLGFEKGLAITEKLRPLVPTPFTMAQFALKWCLSFPAVTTIIPGARNADQARANASVSGMPEVPENTLSAISSFYASEVKPSLRGPD
jgi:aryl-alcohol dehydrogenase-like predicted oxidoreductase